MRETQQKQLLSLAVPYAQQFLRGIAGACLGLLSGGTLATVTELIFHGGQLDNLTEPETRLLVWAILIMGGLGIAIGTAWGVASTRRLGWRWLSRSVLLAFLGAVLAEVGWFGLAIGGRDILEARYPLWPGLEIVLAGLVLPVIGASIGLIITIKRRKRRYS